MALSAPAEGEGGTLTISSRLTVRRKLRHHRDRNLGIGRDTLQRLEDLFGILAWKDAGNSRWRGRSGEGVGRVPSGQHGGHTSGVQERVEVGVLGNALHGALIGRLLGDRLEVHGKLPLASAAVRAK